MTDRMTGAQLDECLAGIGWSAIELARRTSTRQTTVQRWRHDQQPIPPLIAHWLRKLAAFHARNPAPAYPRRGDAEHKENAALRQRYAGPPSSRDPH